MHWQRPTLIHFIMKWKKTPRLKLNQCTWSFVGKETITTATSSTPDQCKFKGKQWLCAFMSVMRLNCEKKHTHIFHARILFTLNWIVLVHFIHSFNENRVWAIFFSSHHFFRGHVRQVHLFEYFSTNACSKHSNACINNICELHFFNHFFCSLLLVFFIHTRYVIVALCAYFVDSMTDKSRSVCVFKCEKKVFEFMSQVY